VFASESDPEVPLDRDTFTKMLSKVERPAGPPKFDGGLWGDRSRVAFREKRAEKRAEVKLSLWSGGGSNP
jgi:hypothetical protein